MIESDVKKKLWDWYIFLVNHILIDFFNFDMNIFIKK